MRAEPRGGVRRGRAENGLSPRFWGAVPSPRDSVPCWAWPGPSRCAPRREGEAATDGVPLPGAGEGGRAAMRDGASAFTGDGASPVTRRHVALGDGLQEEVHWVARARGVRTGGRCLVRPPLSWGCVTLCGARSGPGPGGEGGQGRLGGPSAALPRPHAAASGISLRCSVSPFPRLTWSGWTKDVACAWRPPGPQPRPPDPSASPVCDICGSEQASRWGDRVHPLALVRKEGPAAGLCQAAAPRAGRENRDPEPATRLPEEPRPAALAARRVLGEEGPGGRRPGSSRRQRRQPRAPAPLPCRLRPPCPARTDVRRA